ALLRAVGGDGAVAAPIRIADPGTVALLRAGDRIDVVAAGGDGPARTVATDVPIVGVPSPKGDGAAEGALIVVAAQPAVAARLVAAAAITRLSVTVHSR
ncbi:MAG: flagellar biosynthesis protein FlgA, partial [Mycobacteriales bacterium]